MNGLYFPCSENKGADQLRGYREADLRLCFRICKKPVFTRRGSNNVTGIVQFDPDGSTMLGKIIGYTISYIPARVFPLLTFNTVLKVCGIQVRFNLSSLIFMRLLSFMPP